MNDYITYRYRERDFDIVITRCTPWTAIKAAFALPATGDAAAAAGRLARETKEMCFLSKGNVIQVHLLIDHH